MTLNPTPPLLSPLSLRSGSFTLLAALLMFVMAADAPVLAQGNSGNAPGQNKDNGDDDGGGGDDGGDDQEDPGFDDPGIRYAVTVFLPPVDNVDRLRVTGLNNSGTVVGWYIPSADSGQTRAAWIYDPLVDPHAAVNLNDHTLGIPEGFTLRQSLQPSGGINDAGLVVVHQFDEDTRKGYPGVVDTRMYPYQYHAIPTPADTPRGFAIDINSDGDVLMYLRSDDDPDSQEQPAVLAMGIHNHGLLDEALGMDKTTLVPDLDTPTTHAFLSDDVNGELFVVSRNADHDPIRVGVFSGSRETLVSFHEFVNDDPTHEIWLDYESPWCANRFGDFIGRYNSGERRYRKNGRLLSSESETRVYLHTVDTEFGFVESPAHSKSLRGVNESLDILVTGGGSMLNNISNESLIHRELGRFELASLIDDTTDNTEIWQHRTFGFRTYRINERDSNTGFPMVAGTFGVDSWYESGNIMRDYGILLIPFVNNE